MRVASGGVQHETNTFAAGTTTIEDFIRDSNCGPLIEGGQTIFDRYRGAGAIHGGYIAGAETEGFELIPLLCSRAQPSGLVQQVCFDDLLDRFLERLKKTMPVDGVLLDLHGAMVCEDFEDAEGEFIRAVRECVGEATPIVTTLDLHANITPQMAALSNVIIGFDTYPHVDMHERGAEAAALMAKMIRGEIRPRQSYRQLPMLTMPPMQCTLRQPMQNVLKRLHELETTEGVLTATLSMGFPFADIKDAGVSVLVATDDDQELADRLSADLANHLWELREQLEPQLTKIEDVIAELGNTSPSKPILFADGSDNPGGGAPCDGTIALQALVDANVAGATVGTLFDPETAAQAHQAGVGATIPVQIGGKTDDRHGAPVCGEALVRAVGDGRFVYQGRMMQGVADQLGPTATLMLNNVEVVVCSIRRQCLDPEMLRVADVEPSERRLIVLKSAVHFRAAFAEIAGKIYDADTPGVHRPDFTEFQYQNVRRPIYPLDRNLHWQAK